MAKKLFKEKKETKPEVKNEVTAEDLKKAAEALKEKDVKEDEDLKELDKKIAEVEEKMEVIWQVRSPVFQKSAFIKTKAYTTPVPLYELPDDLRQYLINMGFWTNVYEKGDEWLQRHWADMEKIEELKKFISEHYR